MVLAPLKNHFYAMFSADVLAVFTQSFHIVKPLCKVYSCWLSSYCSCFY